MSGNKEDIQERICPLLNKACVGSKCLAYTIKRTTDDVSNQYIYYNGHGILCKGSSNIVGPFCTAIGSYINVLC